MLKTKPRYAGFLALFVLLISFNGYANQAEKPLRFGFLPSRSPVTLIKHYSPLRDYLVKHLHHDVVLETEADYPTFLLHTKNRKYDFVLTAPHFALLAIDSGKYAAALTYTKALMADILVPKNSPVMQLQQLAGKRIATPPEGAIISMAGEHLLEQHGLVEARAPLYVTTPSHNASIHAMLGGDTDAAIASANITRQFAKRNAEFRKLASTGPLPGIALLVARDLPEQIQVSFVSALTQMNHDPEGKTALKKMGYPGYRKVGKHEFEAARPFLKYVPRMYINH